MKKKLACSFALMMVAVSVLTGCGSGQTTGNGGENSTDAEAVKDGMVEETLTGEEKTQIITESIKKVDADMVVDSVYDGNNVTLGEYLILQNTSEEYAITNFNLQLSLKAEDGTVLAVDEKSCQYFMPGEVKCFVYYYDMSKADIAKIADLGTDMNTDVLDVVKADTLEAPNMNDLEVSGVNIKDDGYGCEIMGTVTNNSQYATDDYMDVYIIFRKDGEAVQAIWDAMTGSISAGQSKTFDLSSTFELKDYDSYEIYFAE